MTVCDVFLLIVYFSLSSALCHLSYCVKSQSTSFNKLKAVEKLRQFIFSLSSHVLGSVAIYSVMHVVIFVNQTAMAYKRLSFCCRRVLAEIIMMV